MMNKSVIITGASSGIGAATAELFASHNYDLLLIARNNDKLQNIKKHILDTHAQVKVSTLAMDLQSFDESLFSQMLTKITTPVVLVNNAGIYSQGTFENTSLDVWNEQIQINLLGAVKITKACWNIFAQNKQGSIVNVASTLGVTPIENTSAYSATKAAMINWTMTLALEGGSSGIRANCVSPGIIDTPIHPFHSFSHQQKNEVLNNIKNIQVLKKIGHPEDIAKAIYFLGSDDSSFTTGVNLNVDGGINIK